MPKKRVTRIKRRWAHVVKNPASYIDPYKVVVGPGRVFHSWHSGRASALREAARINKAHGGYIEETVRR